MEGHGYRRSWIVSFKTLSKTPMLRTFCFECENLHIKGIRIIFEKSTDNQISFPNLEQLGTSTFFGFFWMTTCKLWKFLPVISTFCFGSTIPELGFTQYLFGAVVLILKHTLRSEGFVKVIKDDTAEVKGPSKEKRSPWQLDYKEYKRWKMILNSGSYQ